MTYFGHRVDFVAYNLSFYRDYLGNPRHCLHDDCVTYLVRYLHSLDNVCYLDWHSCCSAFDLSLDYGRLDSVFVPSTSHDDLIGRSLGVVCR